MLFGDQDMKNRYFIFTFLTSAFLTFAAQAQLSANPWVVAPPSPNSGDLSNATVNYTAGGDNVTAPIYKTNNGDIVAVDPWARARDKSDVRTWRGSGQHGKLDYIGEATTYTDAQGQEMIAPEVNRHNMLVVLEHLRKLGYKIPESYDQKIRDLPKNYGLKLQENYDDLNSASDPFSTTLRQMMENIEAGTGLDFHNILFNSVNLLGTD
jgi:hypothetical protein